MPRIDANGIEKHWEKVYQAAPLSELPWEEGRPSKRLIELVESGVVEKGAALDVCCGSGNNAAYLANNGFECYGIDISETAIGYAREKVAAEGKTCKLIKGNVLNMPFPADTFTLVFDRGCFHSQMPEHRNAYAAGIFKVLKKSGKYLMLCFSAKDHSYGPPYGFFPRDIASIFSRFFKIRKIDEFSTGGNGRHSYFLSVLMKK